MILKWMAWYFNSVLLVYLAVLLWSLIAPATTLRVVWEPRDWWVGYYRGEIYHYVCLLPCFPIYWARS